eukprot:403341187
MSARSTKNQTQQTKQEQPIQTTILQQQPINLSRKRSRAQFREQPKQDKIKNANELFEFDVPEPLIKQTKIVRSKRQVAKINETYSISKAIDQDNSIKQRAKSMGGEKKLKEQSNQPVTLTKQSNLQSFFKLGKKCKNLKCEKQTPSKFEDLIKCEVCSDNYHWQCSQQFQETPTQEDEFICTSCQMQLKETKRLKQNYQKEENKEVQCSQCKKQLKSEDNRQQCLKCQNNYHQKCFEKFEDEMFCLKCQKQLQQGKTQLIPEMKVPLITMISNHASKNTSKQTKNQSLTSFFNQTKKKLPETNYFADILKKDDTPQSQLINQFYSQDLMKKQNRKKSVSLTRKKNIFKLSKLIDDPLTEHEIRQSFERAFFAKDLTYANKQIYDDPLCLESKNNINLEPNVQKLVKENIESVQQLRRREELGILPPLILKHDQNQGFYVEAAQDLQDLTLLCEYAGEVRTLRQTIFDKNDSIMELLDTGDSDTSLVIAPQKYSNVGRFFNSINKSSKESKKKQNIRSIRCQIDGKATVMIYTQRNVKKGEQLLYDYNEAKNMYPTDDFV